MQSLRCALRTQLSAFGAMTASDVFRSSPIHGTRRDGLIIGSSSPGLPPLTTILSQRSTRPPSRSGSKAVPIPNGVPTGVISAESPFGSTIATPKVQPTKPADDSIEIIQISRARKGGVKEANGVKKSARKPKTTKGEKIRKQPQSNVKTTTTNEADNSDALSKVTSTKPKITKRTGTTSKLFEQSAESSLAIDRKDIDINEPLNLEPAISRRVDWTPPGQKTSINIESGSSALKQLASSECGDQPAFKDLVHAYSCLDHLPQTTSAQSDEESSFLKKRKRIELVAIQDGNGEPEVPKKSPTKKKAPKKKARTITELATAAYKVPTQSDDGPSSASILDHFPSESTGSAAAPGEKGIKGKGKVNPRKRASKATKKKTAPPKPILLSPAAALDQVAKQDFVFGTSSQLAREPSPSVLKDIQSALKNSNQPEYVDMTALINSDDVELPQQRPRLWDAAARDADGDLFDVEVVDLAGDSPQLPQTSHEPDRFGYIRGENLREACLDRPEAISSDTADSFVNLSDILPPPGEQSVQIESDSPYFSESDMSTSTDIQPLSNLQVELQHQSSKASTSRTNNSSQKSGAAELPPQPNYDLFTDIQLAKEVKAYGFKPIKKRNAMIAMLNQCWQSKVRLGQVGIHTSARRSAAASTSAQPASSATAMNSGKKPRGRPRKNSIIVSEPKVLPPNPIPGKRPRGRPRKNSVNASEPQEPPPSAQPPETPKRPRGRPRKDSLSPSPTAPSQPRVKSASLKKLAVVRSPARRKKATTPIIEIPDSASENGLDLASSPTLTIEQMSSSPPTLDLSLSTTDDTELSLTGSPNDQQAALFDRITKAIKSAPRTRDPENPSWHEKILLYDPIVLEDLTAWLNSGELTRVGCDTEVSPGEVKKWCESKSVCCLWRVNLRGKQRKRF